MRSALALTLLLLLAPAVSAEPIPRPALDVIREVMNLPAPEDRMLRIERVAPDPVPIPEATAALDALYASLHFNQVEPFVARTIYDPASPVPGVTAVVARVFVANPAQSFVAWLYWWRSDTTIPGGHPGTFTQYSLPGKSEAVGVGDLSPLVEVRRCPPYPFGVNPTCR